MDDAYDQAAELLGPDYHLAHQTRGLIADGRHHGASVASRWPILEVHEVDLRLTPRTGNYSCGVVIAELAAPALLGRLLMVSHGPSWAWWAEAERELQAVAVVRRIDYLLVRGGDHGPTLRIADCRRVFDEPVGGVMASDHYGVLADLEARTP